MPAATSAQSNATRCGRRLLVQRRAPEIRRPAPDQRGTDRSRPRDADRRPDSPDGRCDRERRFPDRISGRHAQHHRGDAAAVQERDLSPGARLPGRGVRSGLDREFAPRHAQGTAAAGAFALHIVGWRADQAAGGRGQGRLHRAHARRAALADARRIMTMQQQTMALFAGIGVVLVIASLVGYALKTCVAKGQPHAVIDNLNARIKAWWVMVLVISGAFLFGKDGVIVLFLFISFVALREFMTLTYTRSGDHNALAASFFIVLPAQYFFIYIEWYGLYSIFIPVYAFLILPILEVTAGDTTRFLERAAKMQWGLMICVFCISHVPALLTLGIPGYEGRDILLIVFLVLVVQSSDVLQYVWGKLFGKHKIAPDVSPSKTLEGLVGGVLSATALGASLWWITPFTVWQAALMALAVNVMGFLGGLVMSAIKRDRGVKDWGHMIEGHGGMLDRLDSVVFAAPVFFHATRHWWA